MKKKMEQKLKERVKKKRKKGHKRVGRKNAILKIFNLFVTNTFENSARGGNENCLKRK